MAYYIYEIGCMSNLKGVIAPSLVPKPTSQQSGDWWKTGTDVTDLYNRYGPGFFWEGELCSVFVHIS